MEYLDGRLVVPMRDISNKIIDMGLESASGLINQNIMEIGSMAYKMEEAS